MSPFHLTLGGLELIGLGTCQSPVCPLSEALNSSWPRSAGCGLILCSDHKTMWHLKTMECHPQSALFYFTAASEKLGQISQHCDWVWRFARCSCTRITVLPVFHFYSTYTLAPVLHSVRNSSQSEPNPPMYKYNFLKTILPRCEPWLWKLRVHEQRHVFNY